jgi:integrase
MALTLKMAAVTLQRGGEVVGMRWDEIDIDQRLWTIPAERMKGKRAHLVPLSPLAIDILDQSRSLFHGHQYVFPSPRLEEEKSMQRHALSRAMNRLVTALGIPDATPHDLRRTGATMLTGQKIGIPRFVVSQVLAHAGDTGGAAAVTGIHYDLYDYLQEKRQALDLWASALESVVNGKAMPSNVVELRSGA